MKTGAEARVYIYEVTTASTRFQTASKLPPDAFLVYNGGHDVIFDLKVVAVYPDKDMAQALKDFNLEENNNNLLSTSVQRNIPRKPYYWWR
ncbi:MAG: hypothetical protein IJD28_08115 [Deferribacterales bacterium]|nr:hypothetical protein [Deferribacterales bacterium]